MWLSSDEVCHPGPGILAMFLFDTPSRPAPDDPLQMSAGKVQSDSRFDGRGQRGFDVV